MTTKNDKTEALTLPSDPFKAFPAVVALAFDKQPNRSSDTRMKDILIGRFGIEGSQQYSLESLGGIYNLTRERVRQIERNAIIQIREIVDGRSYQLNNKLSDELLESYSQFNEGLSALGRIVSSPDLDKYADLHGYARMDPAYTNLLMRVFGYKKGPEAVIGFRGQLGRFWYSRALKRGSILMKSFYKVFNSVLDDARYLDKTKLVSEIRDKLSASLDDHDIDCLMKIVKDIEVTDDKVFVTFLSLRSSSDRAYRILLHNNHPMHYSEISSEINQSYGRHVSTEASVKNQMSTDQRFKAIGRSGLWSLSEWAGVTTMTILETIAAILEESGREMSLSEVISATRELRPDAAVKSIEVYLSNDPRFARTDQGYALSHWDIKPRIRKANVRLEQSKFDTVLLDQLEKTPEARLVDLVAEIQAITGLSNAAVRSKIKTAERQGICQIEGAQRMQVSVTKDAFSIKNEPRLEQPSGKMSLIKQEALSILQANIGSPMPKRRLYDLVNETQPCIRSTFYKALSSLTEIRTFKMGSNIYVVLEDNK
jgi:DNA-directed RNA polymerase delta subunit